MVYAPLFFLFSLITWKDPFLRVQQFRKLFENLSRHKSVFPHTSAPFSTPTLSRERGPGPTDSSYPFKSPPNYSCTAHSTPFPLSFAAKNISLLLIPFSFLIKLGLSICLSRRSILFAYSKACRVPAPISLLYPVRQRQFRLAPSSQPLHPRFTLIDYVTTTPPLTSMVPPPHHSTPLSLFSLLSCINQIRLSMMHLFFSFFLLDLHALAFSKFSLQIFISDHLHSSFSFMLLVS